MLRFIVSGEIISHCNKEDTMKKQLAAILSTVLLSALTFNTLPFDTNAVTQNTEGAVQTEETVSALSAETIAYYQEWKSVYLKQNSYESGLAQYYVFYGENTYEQTHTEVPATVSEAHGYGMLIAALMSSYDDDAKEIFDGMYRYYLAHPSSIGPHLMAWQQSDNGRALVDSNGSDSATDGDLDIAYSLLLADRIWGSEGEINYRRAAELVINDIMKYDVSHENNILRLGDWAYDVDENDKYYSATRASDFIMQYFPVFAAVTGDERWIELYDNTYSIIDQFTEQYKTGLLPDFIIKDKSGKWIPAPANFLEDENDGNYYYNSCRTPWRISTDAIVTGSSSAKKYAEIVNAFFKKETGGDPEKIMAGYTPDGRAVSDWDDLCFTAPLMLAAKSAGDTEWHDTIRRAVIELGTDSYFGNTIAMLCLITDDGGWMSPETNSVLKGDANGDGGVDMSDVVMVMQACLNPAKYGVNGTSPDRITAEGEKAGDVDGNAGLTANDALIIQRYSLKLIDTL
jgi:endo-1,4-beta-D-glucanase Y